MLPSERIAILSAQNHNVRLTPCVCMSRHACQSLKILRGTDTPTHFCFQNTIQLSLLLIPRFREIIIVHKTTLDIIYVGKKILISVMVLHTIIIITRGGKHLHMYIQAYESTNLSHH